MTTLASLVALLDEEDFDRDVLLGLADLAEEEGRPREGLAWRKIWERRWAPEKGWSVRQWGNEENFKTGAFTLPKALFSAILPLSLTPTYTYFAHFPSASSAYLALVKVF